MSKHRLWLWILVAAGLILGPIAACGIFIFLSPCDMDGYVTDAQVREAFADDLEAFKQAHHLDLDRWSMPLTCTGGHLSSTVNYRIPAHQSRIGVTYSLRLSVSYNRQDGSIQLRHAETTPDTQTTLAFLQTLPDRLAGFEQDPRVLEFAEVFKREGVRVVGTINGDHVWIQADPSRGLQAGQVVWSGDIFYDHVTQTVTSYSLPNALTWMTFEEASRAQEALDDPAVVEALVGCTLARGRETYANTVVTLRTTPVAADVDLRLVCPDDSRKYLQLRLSSDGRVELKGIK